MKFIESTQELRDNLQNVADLKYFGFDVETTGFDPFTDKLQMVQIGNEKKQYIIDARKVNISPLKGIMEDINILKYTANGMFDYKWGKKYGGFETEPIIDVLNAERILLAGKVHFKTKGYFALEGLAQRYLGVELSKAVRDSFLTHTGSFSSEQLDYGAEDVIVPCRIFREYQKKLLVKESLMPTFVLETRATPAFGDMEYNGIFLDSNKWVRLYEKNLIKRDRYKKETKELFKDVWDVNLLGEVDININSNPQLLTALTLLGYKVKDTQEGTIETDLPKEIHEPIINYREFDTNVSRYGHSFLEHINPVTGRIHTNLWQIEAETGRPASTNPNLLNIKRESEYRSSFVAQNKGSKLITTDYAGQELRIIAEITQDPVMIQAFKDDKNFHEIVGSYIFSLLAGREISITKSEDKFEVLGTEIKLKDAYDITKNINFGIGYGAGPYKVLQQLLKLGIKDATMDNSKEIVSYHKDFLPVLHEVIENIRQNALEDGFSVALGGRKRYFNQPVIEEMPGKDRNERHQKYKARLHAIMREGGNHVIQGTGSEQLKTSLYYLREMIKREKKQDELKLVLTPYDETVFESENNHEQNQYLIEQCMLKAQECFQPTVPAAVESTIDNCWSK